MRKKSGIRVVIGLRTVLPVFLALFLVAPVAAQRRERLINGWKPLHYNVAITLNNQLSEITSARTEMVVEIRKSKVTTIDLDFGEMKVDAVTIDGRPAHYAQVPNHLNVTLSQATRAGAKMKVAVTYHGTPKDGLILTTDRDGRPSATGDNWPDRVHNWIPCLDHPSAKATVTFRITAPVRDLVVANGAFESSQGNFGGTTTWTYDETRPIPPYCMVIVVNEGVRLEAPGSLTPLSYYVPQKDRAYAMQGFSPAQPAVAFFSQLVAPYPYEKLALIVGATRFGGMENSGAIVFGSNLFEPRKTKEPVSTRFGIPERIEDVVAHEIAHQWFGDSVTESTWSDLWLSEGFATYFAGLFIQHYEGEQAFHAYMKRAAETYFAYDKSSRTPIFDRDTEDLFKLLNANNYQKGAWVLHMLRSRLGDEAFFRGLRAYYNAHRDATATTEDLRAALEKASGRNLKEFFSRWVYGSGHPVYELSSYHAETPAGSLTLMLKQLQEDKPFLDPVTIEVTTGEGKKRVTVKPKDRLEKVSLRIKGTPTAIVVDPDEKILKEVISKQ